MNDGYWHVIFDRDRFIALWATKKAEAPCHPEDYLCGPFDHRMYADFVVRDANVIIRCADGIYDAHRHGALRRIVEGLR